MPVLTDAPRITAPYRGIQRTAELDLPTGSPYVSSEGLVLAYNMETLAGGEMADFSGQGNHGTITGTVDVEGRFGRGRAFDGSSDHIQAADSASLDITTALTIAAWVRPDVVASRRILDKLDVISPFDGYTLEIASGSKFVASVYNDGVADPITSVGSYSTGTFFHVATTWEAGTNGQRIYINGAFDTQRTPTNTLIGLNSQPLTVGSYGGVPGRFFNGTIDEPLVFSRALSDDEIRALSNLPLLPTLRRRQRFGYDSIIRGLGYSTKRV